MAFTRDPDVITPQMTSNTAPSGYVASASSIYGSHDAYFAFNGYVLSDGVAWLSNGIAPAWLKIQLPTAKLVDKYKITSRGVEGAQTGPKTWVYRGSNDGTNWIDLDTRTNESVWGNAETRTYIFSNSTAYMYYIVNISDAYSVSPGFPYVAIGELELFSPGQQIRFAQAIGGF